MIRNLDLLMAFFRHVNKKLAAQEMKELTLHRLPSKMESRFAHLIKNVITVDC